MSDQHNSQNVQPHSNSVFCFRCGHKHITEFEENALEDSLKHGWTRIDDKSICKNCNLPQRPYNTPYFVNDDRIPEKDRGWFLDQEWGVHVSRYKLVILTGFPFTPSWEFHKRVQ